MQRKLSTIIVAQTSGFAYRGNIITIVIHGGTNRCQRVGTIEVIVASINALTFQRIQWSCDAEPLVDELRAIVIVYTLGHALRIGRRIRSQDTDRCRGIFAIFVDQTGGRNTLASCCRSDGTPSLLIKVGTIGIVHITLSG